MTKSERKISVQYVASIIILLAGVGLLIAGFCVDPHGEIHPSVLTAFGESLTFVGTVWGIKTTSDRKVYEIDRKYEELRGNNKADN